MKVISIYTTNMFSFTTGISYDGAWTSWADTWMYKCVLWSGTVCGSKFMEWVNALKFDIYLTVFWLKQETPNCIQAGSREKVKVRPFMNASMQILKGIRISRCVPEFLLHCVIIVWSNFRHSISHLKDPFLLLKIVCIGPEIIACCSC